MQIDFNVKDKVHHIVVRFVKAFLPTAKKSYHLKAVNQPELDIHGIASKAAVYNLSTSPKVIEEGLTAGIELMYYLVADGYRIKTPLFNLRMRIPGEYNGSETSLKDDAYPVATLQISREFRKYLKEKVTIEIDGFDQKEGHIAEAQDEATGLINETVTVGNILTIRGFGLKIDSDPELEQQAGLFFTPEKGAPVKAEVIAVNEHRTLKVIVPKGLVPGKAYQLTIETMSSPRNGMVLVKRMRDIRSSFRLIA